MFGWCFFPQALTERLKGLGLFAIFDKVARGSEQVNSSLEGLIDSSNLHRHRHHQCFTGPSLNLRTLPSLSHTVQFSRKLRKINVEMKRNL